MDTLAEDTPKEQLIAWVLGFPGMKFIDWKRFMGEGWVTELHISRTRFRRRLTLSKLGIRPNSDKQARTMHEVYNPGMVNFLPEKYREKLDNADNRARQALECYGIKTAWGRFIPVTAFLEWDKRINAIRDEYYAARDEILANYDSIKRRVICDHVEAAKNAYMVMKAVSPDALTDEEKEVEKIYLRGVAVATQKAFPSRNQILTSFDFQIEYTWIDLPRLAGNGGDDVKLTIDDLTYEQTEALRTSKEAIQQRQQLLAEMNRRVVDEARRKTKPQVEKFFSDVIGQSRTLVADAAANVLASINRNQKLHPKSVEQLQVLCSNLRLLNFSGDREVERAMEMIEEILGNVKSTPLSDIQKTLRSLAVIMRSSVLALGTEEREEREDQEETPKMEQLAMRKRAEADLPEIPTAREEREARMVLEFAIPPWLTEREEREEEVYAGVIESDIIDREERPL